MYLKQKIAFLLTVIIISIASCRPSHKIIAIDPRFAQHISGYTSGMLSSQNHIRVELSSSIDSQFLKNGLPDSTVIEHIFSFEPSIKGKAIWINDRTIEFVPNEALDHKTFYNVSFNLSKLKKVESDLKKFRFQFSTYEQHLTVSIDGMRSMDNYNIEWQRLEGKIKTTDKEDTSKLKKIIEAKYQGKKLNIHFESYYSSENEVRFYIDSIARGIKEEKINITWSGKPIGASEFGSQEIPVRALGDYTVNNLSAKDEDGEQYAELEFSEPLLANQNLNGLVSINDVESPSFAINGNTLKIYIQKRITGIKKIKVSTAIKNCKGHKMQNEYQGEVEFFPSKPKVRIVGSGCILPNSQGLIFPFETINLKSVEVRIIKIFENNVHQFLQVNDLNGNDGLTRVGKIITEKKINLDYNKQDLSQWTKHVIDLNKMISPDPGSIYRISIKFEKKDAIISCENETQETEDVNATNQTTNTWNEENWNDNSFDDYETWEGYGDDYNPCEESYYRGKAVSRNILASDIGLIFKLDENKMSHTFVSNMISTEVMPNTKIEYYDYTKQLIASGTTDQNGILDIPLSRKPFLMVAKNGKQRGYLKLLDANTNSLSKFDIDGEIVQKGIKGFIYAERGVWRPGDSLFLNFILEDKQHQLPENHPVSFELSDPMGKVVAQKTSTTHVNHSYDFRTATSVNAVTGNYTATVKVGNQFFRKQLNIETVKPNRLKIKVEHDAMICENGENKKVKINAKWLHGADAKNLKANVYVTLRQTETKFSKFPDYIFSSPLKSYSSDEIVLFDSLLDNEGNANINCNLHIGSNASGMLNVNFISKVFEEGGDFSIDKSSASYSPFSRYIGIQIPSGEEGANLETNKNYNFSIVSINQNGTLEDANKINLKIYKIDWRWWYEQDDDDVASYLTKSSTIVVKDTMIKTSNGKASFNFKSVENDYARYLFVLTDEEAGHQTGKIVSFDYPYWQRNNNSHSENATMLHFSCDKTKYQKGEQVKISIPSSSNGKALISIENGNRMLKTFWVNTSKGETKCEFTADADMCPNVYVHVTMIQTHANTKNDLPIRMYGIVPIQIDDANSHLEPIISMANELRPESFAQINVKEKSGKKMTYTLAIVDDGLLDLTRFKTPNAWPVFNAKEALGVKTWDMYDNVIGAYAGKLDHLLSIGGDGSYDESNTTKANRFKPMVVFAGPFTIEANKQTSHKIYIPNYVGSVRVMIVAQNEGAYGNTEKTIAIKKPLMLLATLPRAIAPNEEINLPVDIFAMNEKIKDVKIELITNDFLQIESNKQQNIHFSKVGDEVINFKLKVANKIGIAVVKLKATCGSESATQDIEIDVRQANPLIATSKEFQIAANDILNTELIFKNIVGTNTATIECSNVPSINIEKRLDYLIQYPHGCIEQTSSAAFPQLYLNRLTELDEVQQKNSTLNIKRALLRLQLFQTSNGGFSYWPGENEASEFGSNYAGHFMLEAEKQGFTLPNEMKQRWVKYQTELAKNWSANNNTYVHAHGNESYQFMQAYRLYTLALSGSPELGSMNKLREENKLSNIAQCELAMAYQTIGQIEVARKILDKINTQIPSYKELAFGYGSDLRDKAIMLIALNKGNQKVMAEKFAQEISNALSTENWMNTQETAYCLLALCEYYQLDKTTNLSFSYQLNNNAWQTKQCKKIVGKINVGERDFKNIGNLKIKNNSAQKLFVKIITKGIPMMGDTSTNYKHISINVSYKNMKGAAINPQQIKQGTDFFAEVTIKNLGTKGALKEMCLNEIFPSGWEIHNSRMDEDNEQNNGVRYQDIRDDRVYSYFDIPNNGTVKVKILLNATYLGKFYMPSIYSEAMYDNSIHANSKAMWVEVVK